MGGKSLLENLFSTDRTKDFRKSPSLNYPFHRNFVISNDSATGAGNERNGAGFSEIKNMVF